MSGNPAEASNHASVYGLNPPLDEWSQIQLAPLRFDHSWSRNRSPLPWISPYATDAYPNYASLTDAQNRDTTGHSPYEEPQHTNMIYDDDKSQDDTSSPINTSNAEESLLPNELRVEQSTGYAVAEYQARLTAVNGVVIPSPSTLNSGSSEPSGTSSNSDPSANHICPVCGTWFSQKYEVACHFVTCVDRHGNQDGVCWDDCSSIIGQTTTSQESQQVIRQTATPQQSPQSVPPTPTPQQSPQIVQPTPTPQPGPVLKDPERKKIFEDRLNSVNGVVIPSKHLPAQIVQAPIPKSRSSTRLEYACPLCKSRFSRKAHIRSHFAPCVDRNGNPDGLRWDDGLPKLKNGPKERVPCPCQQHPAGT